MVKALPLKKKYKYLTVHEKRGREVRCVCVCGTERYVRPPALVSGQTISCGCKFAETRHRSPDLLSSYPEYQTWCSMKSRCYGKNQPVYPRYGGRGIYVCDDWLVKTRGPKHGFRQFLRDMGRRPSSEHSIERMDNDGPYSPENCVWATAAQQGLNNRGNIIHSYMGVTAPTTELCRRFGKRPAHVLQRLRFGYTIEEAMELPLRAKRHQ